MKAQWHEARVNLAAHPLVWGLARLARRIGPVVRVPGLGVLVSDARMAREILQRDDDFTKNGPGSFARVMTLGLGPVALGNMDGAEHRRLRAAFAEVLSPARAHALVDDHAAALVTLGAQLQHGEHVDLVPFVSGWAGRIVFDVIGIPPPAGREQSASHDLVTLSASMATVLGFRQPTSRQQRSVTRDTERLEDYFRAGYRQPAPPMSLVDRLQTLDMSFEQARGIILLYVIAGTLTVRAALPRLVALLVDNGLLARLAQDTGTIARAVDEGLRLIAPLPATVRIVRRASIVHGRTLAAGTRLVILTGNVARDAKVFPRPDRFDLERPATGHGGRPWYGAGSHYCAGFQLAQRELNAALTTLAAFGNDLRIVKRRVALGPLLPAYRQLVVRAAGRRAC